MIRRWRSPIRARGGRFVIDLGADETAVVLRLMDELRSLLASEAPTDPTEALISDLTGRPGAAPGAGAGSGAETTGAPPSDPGDDPGTEPAGDSPDDVPDDLTEGSAGSGANALLGRLFPVVHPDDPELEAEYQRLMRSELVASKLAAMDAVEAALAPDAEPVDEAGLTAFMQAVNSVRLVLGTMLAVSDDPDEPEVSPGLEHSAEYALYGYLSVILDDAVRAATTAQPG